MNKFNLIWMIDDEMNIYEMLWNSKRRQKDFGNLAKDMSFFSSANEALQKLEEIESSGNYSLLPDRIITDLMMNHLDGYQFIKLVSKMSDNITSKVKIYICSANKDTIEEQNEMFATYPFVVGYLLNPLQFYELRELK
jgi:CheY-like chemotaxis protein